MAGRWTVRAGLVLTACLGIDLAEAQAQILPVTLTGSPLVASPIAGAPVTVSLSPADWLPRPGNTVTVTVNLTASAPANASVTSVALVCPDGSVNTPCPSATASTANPITNGWLRSSAFEGECTNSGSGFTTDFTFNAATGVLTSHDCGGVAVIRVEVKVSNTHVSGSPFFFVPLLDDDWDGMPNTWEAQFCTGGSVICLDKLADSDPAPVTSSLVGDGLAAIDEYRCCKVSGAYPRPRPDQKDWFFHLVNPQCLPASPPEQANPLTSTLSLLGGGATTYPTALAATLLANVSTMTASSAQIHNLCAVPGAQSYSCTEWVDNFLRYTNASGVEFTTSDGATLDRQINGNRVYPASTPIQRGVRFIECTDRDIADPIPTSPLGDASRSSPNAAGNKVVIFTRRIEKNLKGLITAGVPRKVRHRAFENGSWVEKFTTLATSSTEELAKANDYIVSVGINFILAMEAAHSLNETPTLEGDRRTSYGYHHAPGTGSNLDQKLVNTVANSTSGFNNFDIPFFYNEGDRRDAVYD